MTERSFNSSMLVCSRGRGRSIMYSVLMLPGSLPSIRMMPVAEEQGLVDVVGDEDDGALFLFPDARGFLLHEHTGLGVQLPEGLVKSMMFGEFA